MAKQVTMKSTKQEIYDALMESKEKLESLNQSNFDPVREVKKKEEKAVVESAKESVKNNLFSEELSKKFTDLEAAIKVKEAELKEMYGIEKELQDITAIINAGKEISAKLDEEQAAKKAEIAAMTDNMLKEYQVKKKEAAEEFSTYQVDLDKQREREVEEYEYNLKRFRSIENDKWEDEKLEREADIQAREAKAQEMYEDAESKIAYIAELEEKVNSIPELVEKAKAEGAEAAEKEAGKEYGYKKTMAEKEHNYEVQRLEDKVERLEEDLAKSTALNDSLQEKLDNAYVQIRELATKTVESTGGVKILNSGVDSKK